jgi:aspartate kinase
MQVYKFGGASVKDADGIINLTNILKNTDQKNILVVLSAMGKTTNALEELAKNYFQQDSSTFSLFDQVKKYHFDILDLLFPDKNAVVFDDINNAFVEIEWMLEDVPQDDFDFIYDQIVCIGEIISSKIVSYYLNNQGILNKWIDARSYVQTNNNYREAKVNWNKTENLITKDLPSILENQLIITQGFIGNTSENFSTTLGREGSDYSAAIFAFCLNADKVTVWKDVPGILNADPKIFENTHKIDVLSYAEAIEMTYYGATVIHPKTIKPLQNKHIPLYVKPFLHPEEIGTVIKEADVKIEFPIIILKNNQILISISSKDFSFITEKHLRDIFKTFTEKRIKINVMQVSALSFSACFDADDEKLKNLMNDISEDFNFRFNDNLKLITIRNSNEQTIQKYVKSENLLLEQRSRNTAQFVLKD